MNYFRISKEIGEKVKSARIHNYIFAKERGPRLYMSVPSWLSRHTLMFGSVVGGFEPPWVQKNRLEATRREARRSRTKHQKQL